MKDGVSILADLFRLPPRAFYIFDSFFRHLKANLLLLEKK